ncbi:MAG TPA: GDSL-type esterase/lipase family protein [Chloroflexia bacterium]
MPHHPAHNVPPPPTGEEPTAAPLPVQPGQALLFFGDSITAATPGYLDVLQQVLSHRRPDLDLRLLNAGIPGNTVRDLAARLDRDVLARRPDWVVICIGANDYFGAARGQGGVPLAEFEAVYRALVARLQGAGIDPILMTIPVIGSDEEDSPIPDPRAYNATIKALAQSAGLRLVDIHRAFYAVY